MQKQLRVKWTALAVVFGLGAAGCGGGGGNSGPTGPAPGPGAASGYVVDQTVASVPQTDPTGTIDYFPSGYTAAGAWFVTSPSGYYINGAFTTFPASQVTGGTNVSVWSGGGNFVWATYTTTGGQGGIAILNLTTMALAQVVGVDSPAVSPDGTSAFVAVENSSGAETGQYETISDTGVVTASTFTMNGFVPYERSDAGWTVGVVTTSSAAKIRKAIAQARLAAKAKSRTVKPFQQSTGAAYLISPTGAVVTLNGQESLPECVNDSGISGGYDGDNAVFWDASGNETSLGSGVVEGILDNGLMIGSFGGANNAQAAMWQPGGYRWNLSALTNLPSGWLMTDGIVMQQSSGDILCAGYDANGNGIFFAIDPVTTPTVVRKPH